MGKVEKKMGRPTTNPKELNTRIRLSHEDVDMLESCSKKLGVTKAEVIRKGIKMVYDNLQNYN
ncbi:MAG: hypothetical protein HXK79_03355 [Lachnospiraceae bacterium]|nr:hypothetical protein [Lachnospiraceae bacterium]